MKRLLNLNSGRRGAGIMSILVAGVVLIVLFMLAGTFRHVGRDVLKTSFEEQAFEKRFPGAARPGRLSGQERTVLAEALTAALADADPKVRKSAGFALGRIGPEAAGAVPALIKVMSAGDAESRRGAVAALEGIAALDVPKRVRWAVTAEAVDWRARKALAALGTPEALRALAAYTGPCPPSFRDPAVNWCN